MNIDSSVSLDYNDRCVGSGLTAPEVAALTADEEAKVRESVRLLALAEAELDFQVLQWSNHAVQRLLATIAALRDAP